MNDKIEKVSRKLFTNSKMELDFFMYLPTGYCNNGTMNINCNPALYIRYKKSNTVTEEYDFQKAGYKITPRNLYDVIKLFNTVMKWFYDDKYSDLFLLDDNGDIIFNADYNKLSVSTFRGDYGQQIMQAIPTIVKYGDKRYEGIHLYINTSGYCIPLTYQEVSSIFGILRDFSFTEEITQTLLSCNYILKSKSLMTREQFYNKTPFD